MRGRLARRVRETVRGDGLAGRPVPRPGPTSQICAHNDTLILDEDGLYDPTSFNDRLLLGMKGQLSEAELHFLRARLRGGILAKARRGELRLQLPIGLAYDSRSETVLDPDGGVRQAISLLFETFAATGSAFAVVKAFRDQQLLFPGRHRSGPRAGELYWNSLCHDQVLNVLHNPAYAGAYVWRRVANWIRRKHPGISRKEFRRRYCGGGWQPKGRELALFNAGQVTTTRYRYRGSVIPSPWPLAAA